MVWCGGRVTFQCKLQLGVTIYNKNYDNNDPVQKCRATVKFVVCIACQCRQLTSCIVVITMMNK